MDNGRVSNRLTVSEAAEKLQISKDAVRKRIQRGTLRHDKTLDGHVYVYLDEDGEALGTKEREVKGEGEGRALQLLDVASLLAVVSIATYVVGLFAYWYPISKNYTEDFSAAWYATSLVPRSVVVGHGVKQLLLPYLVALLVFGVFGVCFLFLAFNFQRRKVHRGVQILVYVSITIFVGALSVYLVSIYYLGVAGPVGSFRNFVRANGELSTAQQLAVFALQVLFFCLILPASLLFRSVHKGKKSPTKASGFGEMLRLIGQRLGSSPRRSNAAVSLVFLAYFVWVIYVSLIAVKSPLSKVELSGQRHVKGKLLTHADGYWYIFEQRGIMQEAKLVAIPDNDVKEVRVSE
jgi:excisionase family DNA binding protein